MFKNPKTRKRIRITLLVLIVLGVIALFTVQLWLPRIGIWYSLSQLSNDPAAHSVPIKKEIGSIQERAHLEYTYNGLIFRVPWTDLTKNRSTEFFGKNFNKGKSFVGIVPDIPSKPNNFSFLRDLFYSTTNDIGLFSSTKESLSRITLVYLKSIYYENPAYEFSTLDIRGFQFGNQESRAVSVYFVDKDEHEFLMTIIGATNDEIDYIISSIRLQK